MLALLCSRAAPRHAAGRAGCPGDGALAGGRHSPCLVDVDAFVGGAGGRRLGERGRGEDALGPCVHGGLEGQRDA